MLRPLLPGVLLARGPLTARPGSRAQGKQQGPGGLRKCLRRPGTQLGGATRAQWLSSPGSAEAAISDRTLSHATTACPLPRPGSRPCPGFPRRHHPQGTHGTCGGFRRKRGDGRGASLCPQGPTFHVLHSQPRGCGRPGHGGQVPGNVTPVFIGVQRPPAGSESLWSARSRPQADTFRHTVTPGCRGGTCRAAAGDPTLPRGAALGTAALTGHVGRQRRSQPAALGPQGPVRASESRRRPGLRVLLDGSPRQLAPALWDDASRAASAGWTSVPSAARGPSAWLRHVAAGPGLGPSWTEGVWDRPEPAGPLRQASPGSKGRSSRSQ